MEIKQFCWAADSGWKPSLPNIEGKETFSAQWVLAFGNINNKKLRSEVINSFPGAVICACSTAGEIIEEDVLDDCLVLTVIQFNSDSSIEAHAISIASAADSFCTGAELAGQMNLDGLHHVFVLSEGLDVNVTELVRGMGSALPDPVMVTGGLSGDADRFQQTQVWLNDLAGSNLVVAIGLYGEQLVLGHGSLGGGWDAFGPNRVVTKSVGNVLYELDNQSALELYKSYLGEYAEGLPATGLLFPLSVSGDGVEADGLVRTILGVDEAEQSLTFAGDIPEGCQARLMRANFDHLIDGACSAAEQCLHGLADHEAQLAILISCVGRKMVLKQRVEEEVESVRSVLGDAAQLTGFYSYGEISPLMPRTRCTLHNQTMTITTLSER